MYCHKETFITYFFTWCVDPCQMSEMRVHAACDNFGVDFLKLINAIREGQNFGWTHESAEKSKHFQLILSRSDFLLFDIAILTNPMDRKRIQCIFRGSLSVIIV